MRSSQSLRDVGVSIRYRPRRKQFVIRDDRTGAILETIDDNGTVVGFSRAMQMFNRIVDELRRDHEDQHR